MFSTTSILEEKHTVPVDKLCNITVELHDIGLVDSVVLGAATFKVSPQTLYPAGACGFFDLVPPGGQPGSWKEHADSFAVCELSFAPQCEPTAPSCLLTDKLVRRHMSTGITTSIAGCRWRRASHDGDWRSRGPRWWSSGPAALRNLRGRVSPGDTSLQG